MNEIVFEVIKQVDKIDGIYYTAKAIGHSIFTEGNTIEELHNNIKDAVECYFEGCIPKNIIVRALIVERELKVS